MWVDKISHGEGVEGEENGTCKFGKQYSRDCPRTQERRVIILLWRKNFMREQKDKEQQQCILVFQQRRIPFKYLTFHEVFKNSNTCYLWNIWKVQEGIKKYKKEKIIKITSVNFVVYHQPFFLSVCIYNKHTHVFFYKLRYYESSLGCCLFSFSINVIFEAFPHFHWYFK